MIRLLPRSKIVSLVKNLQPTMSKRAPDIKGRMFSVQASLPKFPVPPLEQTMEKYLRSVKPLLTEEEYRYTQKVCDEFQKDVGPKLQKKLHERADKTVNWLSEWWKHFAYLDFRAPVVINSNPGVLFPKKNFNSLEGQLRYASKLIAGMLDYKAMIDSKTLPVEHLGKRPLCMVQYFKILSACRVPGEKIDTWDCYPPDKPGAPNHITVLHNNHIFSLDVYGKDGQPLSCDQLYQQFLKIIEQSNTTAPPIGILTMEHRDNWAKTYKAMIKDSVNKASLDDIHRSILVLCLDKPMPESQDLRTMSGHQLLHGGGSSVNTANRWFDKTIQFIVGAQGYSGLNYEHTTAEGPPVIHLMDHCIDFIEKDKDFKPANGLTPPRKLQFNLTDSITKDLNQGCSSANKMISDLDLVLFSFEDFGKNFPKSQKVSPDSFIQTAIQLAFYRLHKIPCASYESASIRMFQHGRTETIRSCSIESHAFTVAMMDPSVSNQKKAELMRSAISSHKSYTNDAISGKGVDRHLLGLKLAALESGMELPDLHKDRTYTYSGSWRISTSQVPAKSDSVLFFGPVVPDGYGLCYNPQENMILFGVSSFKHNTDTVTADVMVDSLKTSLFEMRDVLASTMKANL